MIQKILLFLLCAIFFSSCSLFKRAPKTMDSVSEVSPLEQMMIDLAGDETKGRLPGNVGYEIAANYVESKLKEYGIAPYYNAGYRDTFQFKGAPTYNMVGLIGEYDPSKEHIILGAHLDHIGMTKDAKDSIYNGANDNASGVTAVLQIAKSLSQENFDKNIVLALFSAEESGLLGSKHLAKRFKSEGVNLVYMLNFEMIGKTLTTGENEVYITGYNKSNCAELCNSVMKRKFIRFLPAEIRYSLFSRSDNAPFYFEYKVPCHTISTFDFENYKYYHDVRDEVSEMDIENMEAIIESCRFLVRELLIRDVRFSLNKDDQ